MKERVREMFEQVTMPESTEKAIRQAMADGANGKKRRMGPVGKAAVTFAAMVVICFAMSPTARAAVNGWVVKYFWPDSDITVYEVNEGEVEATVAVVDTEAPAFARIINGRLYFLGNGEKIDITDLIREDTPYYYSYVDEYGMTHDMAVGYSGSLDNFGIYEFIWREKDGNKDWTVGTGRNFMCNETQSRYPWVDIVWEDLGIPWAKPE